VGKKTKKLMLRVSARPTSEEGRHKTAVGLWESEERKKKRADQIQKVGSGKY